MIEAFVLMLAIITTTGVMIALSGRRFARDSGYMNTREYRRSRMRRQAERAVATSLCTPARRPLTSGQATTTVTETVTVAPEERYAWFEWLEVQDD